MTDGYPDEEELAKAREWPPTDWPGLMAYVRARWQYAECGYWSEETYEDEFRGAGTRYLPSTGGWSGNEEWIGALHDNRFFWHICWWSSRRGGHHEFRIRNLKDPVPPGP